MSNKPDLPEDFGDPWMSNLEEIELPDPVPFTFDTPGWYLLAGLMTLAVVWFGWHLWKRRRANAYRGVALEELAKLDSPVGLPELLKRTALAAYPRAEVAILYGDSWLGFLDGTLGTTAFTQGAGRRLPDLAYSPGSRKDMSTEEVKELFELARRWVRRHH